MNKKIEVDEYIIKEAQNSIRIASNILDSRKRLTAADRSIDFSERLLNWVLSGEEGERPKGIPENHTQTSYIEDLVNEYITKELPDANTPYHYQAEIAAGLTYFIEFLKQKQNESNTTSKK